MSDVFSVTGANSGEKGGEWFFSRDGDVPPTGSFLVCARAVLFLAATAAVAGEVPARPHPRVPSALTFPPTQAAAVVVRDGGVDVTSPRYAAERGFPEPLRLVRRELAAADWAGRPVPYGTAAIDPARGRLRFFGGRKGPVEVVGRVRLPNGKPLAAARRGNHLFFMTDSNLTGLLVADVSDPSRPRVVAEAGKTGAWTTAMVMIGDVICAAVSGLLHAWDVSDPLHPKALPTLRFGGSRLASRGRTLYFVKGRDELGTMDVSDPRRMKLGPSLTFKAAERIEAPRFLGDCMLVPARLSPEALARQDGEPSAWKSVPVPLKEGLGPDVAPKLIPVVYVLKLTDGEEPEPVACWVGGPLAGAARVGDRPVALLRGSRGGLAFVDASDPSAPRVASIRGELKGSVALDGTRLYLSRRSPCRQDGGLFVYDLSELKRPRLLGKLIEGDHRFMEERSEWRIALVDGRHVYIADPMFGFLIADVSDPAKPRVVGALAEAGRWLSVAVTDQRIFLAGDPGGLAILDGRSPSAARRVGSFMVGPGWGVAGRGTVAFVANGMGLRIVETADPAHPVELASLGGIPDARVVRLHGHHAIVLGSGRSAVIDVRDPRQPRLLGRFATRKPADVAVAGNRLYVGDAELGLLIHDIGDLDRRVGSVLRLRSAPVRIAIRGSHVFIGTRDGLAVADLGDPRHPKLIAETKDGRGGVLAGDCLYGCAYYGEHNLFVTDVSDPTKPRVIARHNPGRYSYATDVALHRGLVYLTSLPYLSILRTPVSSQAPRGRVTVGAFGIH